MINVKRFIERDSVGRVISEILNSEEHDSVKIGYEYDSNGNLFKRTVKKDNYGDSRMEYRYVYDSKNRLNSEFVEKWKYNRIECYEKKYGYSRDDNLLYEIYEEPECPFSVAYKYDADGRVTKKEIFFNDRNKQIFDYSYDLDGRLSQRKCTYINNEDNDSKFEFFYNFDGNVVKREKTATNKKNMIETLIYSSDTLTESIVRNEDVMLRKSFNFRYDSNGRVIMYNCINQYGEQISRQLFYDEFGNEIFCFTYNNDEKITEKSVLKQCKEICVYSDDNSKLIKQVCYDSSGKSSRHEYIYDSVGNLTKEIRDYNGIKIIEETIYDKNNNITKKIFKKEEGRNSVSQYEYNYEYNNENILTKESLTDYNGRTVICKYSYNQIGATIVEIDNSENAEYDIDYDGKLYPKRK